MIQDIRTDEEFNRFLSKNDGVDIIEVYNSQSFRLNGFAKLLDDLSQHIRDVSIYRIDLNAFPNADKDINVEKFPTIIIYRYGVERCRYEGRRPDIDELIKRVIDIRMDIE
jgi:hypothetical protein